MAQSQAFLRVVLAVFVIVRTVNEEKGGRSNFAEIPGRSVMKVLLDLRRKLVIAETRGPRSFSQ
jgi:hypothetical protein